MTDFASGLYIGEIINTELLIRGIKPFKHLHILPSPNDGVPEVCIIHMLIGFWIANILY